MRHGLLWDEALLTLISLMDASVSAEMDVSPLPLREEVPPREAKVAADRLETVRAPYNHTHINCLELSFPHESWVCSFPSFFFFTDMKPVLALLNYALLIKIKLSKK